MVIVINGLAVGDLTRIWSLIENSKNKPNWFIKKMNMNRVKAYKDRCFCASTSATLSLTIPFVKSIIYSKRFCFLLGFKETLRPKYQTRKKTAIATNVPPKQLVTLKFKPNTLTTTDFSFTS